MHPRRAVPAAVVDHQQLVGLAAAGEILQRLAEARRKAVLLVVGGDDDGQFDAVLVHTIARAPRGPGAETGQYNGAVVLCKARSRAQSTAAKSRGATAAGRNRREASYPAPAPGARRCGRRGAPGRRRRNPRRPPAAPLPRRCTPSTGCARRRPEPWKPSLRAAAARTPPRRARAGRGGRSPQRPRDLRRADAAEVAVRLQQGALSGRQRQDREAETRQATPAPAAGAPRGERVGTSLTSASKMPGMAIHGRRRGAEPPALAGTGGRAAAAPPRLSRPEALAQEVAQVRRDHEGRERPGVDRLDPRQQRPEMGEPPLVALAEMGERARAPDRGRRRASSNRWRSPGPGRRGGAPRRR